MVVDVDWTVNGACLPGPGETRLCMCGAVVVHDSHKSAKLHRRRTERILPPSRDLLKKDGQRGGQDHAGVGSPGGGLNAVAANYSRRP
ncbi:hypothetical protein MTO96_052396 [Rhipicephalus appendiculatus]